MDFLAQDQTLALALKLGGGFLAAAAGIALWSRTRDAGWVLVIAASLLSYVEVLLGFLEYLGLFPTESYRIGGVNVVKMAFAGGVPLMYALGFLLLFRSQGKGS